MLEVRREPTFVNPRLTFSRAGSVARPTTYPGGVLTSAAVIPKGTQQL